MRCQALSLSNNETQTKGQKNPTGSPWGEMVVRMLDISWEAKTAEGVEEVTAEETTDSSTTEEQVSQLDPFTDNQVEHSDSESDREVASSPRSHFRRSERLRKRPAHLDNYV